jgi:hypothetical protein
MVFSLTVMKSRVQLLGWLILGAGWLGAGSAYAIAPKGSAGTKLVDNIEVGAKTFLPETYQPLVNALSLTGSIRTVEHDLVSNAIRSISQHKLWNIAITSQNGADFEQAALNAIAKQKQMFGVNLNDVRIRKNATLISGRDASVSLDVYRDGLKIEDASILFSFKDGILFQVLNESYGEAVADLSNDIGPSSSTENLTTNSLKNLIGDDRIVKRLASSWRVLHSPNGYELAKVDNFMFVRGTEPLLAQLRAVDGSVFEIKTQRLNAKSLAESKIFPRSHGETVATTPLSFIFGSGFTGSTSEEGVFSALNLSTPKLEGLSGKFLKIIVETGDPVNAEAVRLGEGWNIALNPSVNPTEAWDSPEMAQAMVYVSANKIIQTAQKFIQPEWFNTPLEAHVNHDDTCNAYWDGKTINFFKAGERDGDVCANTGLISDVIFHEWGHGLDDNTGGIKDRALSEGFGDALANFMTDDSVVGLNFMPVAGTPVRNTDVVKVYPKDASFFDPHSTGLIVGGAFWELSKLLKETLGNKKAKELMGTFLFKGVYKYNKMTDVYKVLLALDDDNADLEDGTPNLCTINKAFSKRGLAKVNPSCT